MVAEFAIDPIQNGLWPDDQARFALSTPVCDRSRQLGRRAVVIGAGVGGLAAATALTQHFERVEILERDRLAASAGSRSGTPQDRHPHGLLAGGLRALDRIFPDFKRDLAAAGAVPVSFMRDVQFERPSLALQFSQFPTTQEHHNGYDTTGRRDHWRRRRSRPCHRHSGSGLCNRPSRALDV